MSRTPIAIIDLFAGPGGLGEGFSSLEAPGGTGPAFNIALSVEKDPEASRTLRWRAFTRALYRNGVAANTIIEELRSLAEPAVPEPAAISQGKRGRIWKDASNEALSEARQIELGPETRDEVSQLIAKRVRKSDRWVLIGGPPCQAYSLVGRARNKGIADYSARDDKRHFLYREYLQVLGTHEPAVFIMENVKGILSAKVDSLDIFQSILDDLRAPGRAIGLESGPTYSIHVLDAGGRLTKASDSVVRMELFGIPQRRHRVILVGVRDDLKLDPGSLTRSPHPVASSLVLDDLPRLRSGLSRSADTWSAWSALVRTTPAAKWVQGMTRPTRDEWGAEVARQLNKLATGPALGRGEDITAGPTEPAWNSAWYRRHPHDYVLNHSTRAHMASDLQRYLFAATFARVAARSPNLHDFPPDLLPAHENLSAGAEMIFSDRFKVQISNAPSSTVTSHIAKDGHYFIHSDPSQCRSLTVREAARLQTFPDDYYFCGGRTSQYTQVGNAVPPLLARQVAEVVHDALSGVPRKFDALAGLRRPTSEPAVTGDGAPTSSST